MKRHILSVLCVLLLAVLVIGVVGCDGTENPEQPGNTTEASGNTTTGNSGDENTPSGPAHEHTYTDAWTNDADNHWHKATCTDGDACATAIASKAAHADANNDKVCDVCAYDYGHTHTYADTEWTSDKTGHWHAVSCGCTIDVKDMAAHTDANNDGACDVCEFNDGHEHTFAADAWTVDATNHWHAASCGHSVTEDVEKHEFNDVGICEVCGYNKNEMTVENAINIGVFYDYLVNGGNIYWGNDSYYLNETAIEFKLGNAMAQYSVKTDYENYSNYYVLTPGGVFAVREDLYEGDPNPVVSKPYDSASDWVTGYKFEAIFGYDIETAYYGVPAMLEGLYNMAKADANMAQSIAIIDGKTYYIFSFTSEPIVAWDGAVSVYELTATFSLGEGGNFEYVSVVSDKYECEADDPEAATPTYHKIHLYPVAVSQYDIELTAGTRDLTAKYAPENMLATDFKLTHNDADVQNSTIKVETGSFVELYVVPTAPTSANIAFDQITWESNDLNIWIWDESGQISFSAPAPGTYTFTVKTLNSQVKTFTVEVSPKALTELIPTVDGAEKPNGAYTAVVTPGSTANVIIGAVPNEGADGSYTATVDNGTLKDNLDGTYTLQNAAAGTYVVTLTSTVDANIKATLTITVQDTPLEIVDVEGTWVYEDYGLTDTFVFENGVLTVNDPINWDEWTGTYTYTENADGTLVINTDKFTIKPNADGSAYELVAVGYGTIPLTKQAGNNESAESAINGVYDVEGGAVNYGITLTFNNGTLVVVDELNWGMCSGTYNYTINAEGGIDVTKEDGSAATDFWFQKTQNGSYTFQCTGMRQPVEMVLVSGGSGDDEPETGLNGSYDVMGGVAEDGISLTFDNGTLTVVDVFNWDKYSGTYNYVVNADESITITDAANVEITDFWFVVAQDGSYMFQCVGLMMPQEMVLVSGGNAGDNNDDIGALIANQMFEGTGYILDFEYNTFAEQNPPYGYIDFTYSTEGNNIIITLKDATYTGELLGATFVYNAADETITANLSNGNIIVFAKMASWW